MDPISSSFASGIGATIKIFEVVYQIQATDEQTSDILNTANHVERNLKEAQRLLRAKAAFLDIHDYEWVESVIRDTRDALQGLAKLIEPARVEKLIKNDIGMMTKAYWAFKSNPQARDKHAMLNLCHQTLMVVITRLHSTNLPALLEVPGQGSLPPPYDHNMEKLWTWRDQRNRRKRSTSSLKHEIHGGSVFLATTDRQELEVPPLDSNSYFTAASITDSQRAHSAHEVRNYNPDYHLIRSDTPPKPAPSQNGAFHFPSHPNSSTSPYSHDRWLNASHSNISLPRSVTVPPSATTIPTHLIYPSHHKTPTAPEKGLHMYEMSATAPPSPERQQTPQIILPLSLPGKIDHNPIHPLFHLSSSSDDVAGSDSVKESSTPGVLPHRSELAAEPVLAPPDADAASGAGAWSSSSPDVASPTARPGVGGRVRSTGNRDGGLRGSWLAYQTSLRESKHGREGGGWT